METECDMVHYSIISQFILRLQYFWLEMSASYKKPCSEIRYVSSDTLSNVIDREVEIQSVSVHQFQRQNV